MSIVRGSDQSQTSGLLNDPSARTSLPAISRPFLACTWNARRFAFVSRISVDLLAGYRYAQLFAPKDKDYIAIEPMTASMSALTSGRGLRFVPPGERFRAAFRIRID